MQEKNTGFPDSVLCQLRFRPKTMGFGTRWSNPKKPEDGWYLQYEQKGRYLLAAADYRVPASFFLPFSCESPQLRFGNMYVGQTDFQLEGEDRRSSLPAAFLVREEHLHGVQFWNTGERCRGIEVTLYPAFLEELQRKDAHSVTLSRFERNTTYHSLPSTVTAMLRSLFEQAQNNLLRPLMLEGILLQCMAELAVESEKQEAFQKQISPCAWIGKRKISFSEADLYAVHQARRILEEHPEDTLSLPQLGRQVFLNTQKLKAGFLLCFHTTVGQYRKSCRMAKATALLTTTDRSIGEISSIVGYESCASFIKAFRQNYGQTPLEYRRCGLHCNDAAS